jgi:hypothetical protein
VGEKLEFLGADGRVDVTRIMASIRENLHRAEGEEAIDARAERLLLGLAEDAELDPEFLERLASPRGGWNLIPDYPIETHRRGLGRRGVVLLKSLVRPLVRLYTDVPLRRQAQINVYLVAVCRALAREIVRLQAEKREGGRPGA